MARAEGVAAARHEPGPFGMAQTGVPFGDVTRVRDWLGIEAPSAGRGEHPKRPVYGFACPRAEVSGRGSGAGRATASATPSVLRSASSSPTTAAALPRSVRRGICRPTSSPPASARGPAPTATRLCGDRQPSRAALGPRRRPLRREPGQRCPRRPRRRPGRYPAPESGKPGRQSRLGRGGRACDRSPRRRASCRRRRAPRPALTALMRDPARSVDVGEMGPEAAAGAVGEEVLERLASCETRARPTASRPRRTAGLDRLGAGREVGVEHAAR